MNEFLQTFSHDNIRFWHKGGGHYYTSTVLRHRLLHLQAQHGPWAVTYTPLPEPVMEEERSLVAEEVVKNFLLCLVSC